MLSKIYVLAIILWTIAVACQSAPLRDDQGNVKIIYHVGDIVEHAYSNDAYNLQQASPNNRSPNSGANNQQGTANSNNQPPGTNQPSSAINPPNPSAIPNPGSHINQNPVSSPNQQQPTPINPNLPIFPNQPASNNIPHNPSHFPVINPPPSITQNQNHHSGRHQPSINPNFGGLQIPQINPFFGNAGQVGFNENGVQHNSNSINGNHNRPQEGASITVTTASAHLNHNPQAGSAATTSSTTTVSTFASTRTTSRISSIEVGIPTTTVPSTTTTPPPSLAPPAAFPGQRQHDQHRQQHMQQEQQLLQLQQKLQSQHQQQQQQHQQQQHQKQQHQQQQAAALQVVASPHAAAAPQAVATPQAESSQRSLESFLAMLDESKTGDAAASASNQARSVPSSVAPPHPQPTTGVKVEDQRPSASVAMPTAIGGSAPQLPRAEALIQPAPANQDWSVYDDLGQNQPNQTAVVASDHKYGYVVHGNNFKRFRVEEKAGNGFITGLFGVHHNNGNFRGVQYSADSESVHPKILYETLVKFLSL